MLHGMEGKRIMKKKKDIKEHLEKAQSWLDEARSELHTIIDAQQKDFTMVFNHIMNARIFLQRAERQTLQMEKEV
jgi:hypothetical protein